MGPFRTLAITLSVLTMALAGCAEDAPAVSEPIDDIDVQVEATSTTGVIRGVVVDGAIVPVVGATVTVQGGPSTTTNENGGFGFSDLEPGTYFLTVEKLGWFSIQQSAEVTAGVSEPPLVRVLMERDAAATPFYQATQWRGYFTCSTVALQVCPAINLVSSIAGGGDITQDSFIATILVERPPSWITSELVWESTQLTGDNLEFYLETVDKEDRTDWDTKTILWGPSSLQFRIDEAQAAKLNYGVSNDVRHRIFPGGVAPDLPLRLAGAQVDQAFDVFGHVFYGYAPPEDWRFTDDPNPPSPPV